MKLLMYIIFWSWGADLLPFLTNLYLALPCPSSVDHYLLIMNLNNQNDIAT